MLARHLIHRSRNRSQVSLEPPQAQDNPDKRAYADSPLHSPGLQPQSAPSPRYDDGEEDHESEQSYDLPYRSEEARFYQLDGQPAAHPTRSQSTRTPNLINTNQPTIHLVGPHSSASTPSSAIDENPDRYYQQAPLPPVHKPEPKKKRGFFGLGGSSSSKDSAKGATANSQKLGRSISVRRKEQPEPPAYIDAGNRVGQQRWSTSDPPPADEEDEEEDGGAGLRISQHTYAAGGPPLPDKDPLRSPAFPPPLTHEEYVYGRPTQQGTVQTNSSRHPLDRQGSYQSSWDKTAQQVNKHSRSESVQQHTPSSYHPSPSSPTSTSSHPFAQRAPQETLHQSYLENSRPSSQQSLEPPPPSQHHRAFDYPSKQSQNSASPGGYIQGSMGLPPGQQPPPNRRSSESTQQSQTGSQGREAGAYHPYNQGTQQGPVLPSNAPPPQYTSQLGPQGQNYRGNSQTSPMAQQQQQLQGHREPDGRSTPPPSRSRDDLASLDVGQLLLRHDELQDKYRKVKKYYFDKDAQVLQLQNTLAHQRLAQSRTSLDDNEYSNRFQRLDGAINNLAFNLRRDWRSVPPWLAPHVNRDAANQPTKEMTAVGRACISRWLVDELLERYFHPGLDPAFSAQLKIIEKNLRRFAAPTPSEEEKDALLARISNWRLSTLDGLQEVLSSSQAAENRTALTESLVEKLTASLSMMLKEPSPPGLEGGVSMIVELAVGIAANLPLESRDVFVEFVAPGTLVQEAWMKVETGLPPLINPGEGPNDGEAASITSKQTEDTGSIESKETAPSTGTGSEEVAKEVTMQQQQQPGAQGKKKGMFGGLMGSSGTKKGNFGVGATLPGSQPQGQGQGQQQQQQQQQQGPPKEDRVRFSTFMAVEVRGRSVLVKAPVYVRE